VRIADVVELQTNLDGCARRMEEAADRLAAGLVEKSAFEDLVGVELGGLLAAETSFARILGAPGLLFCVMRMQKFLATAELGFLVNVSEGTVDKGVARDFSLAGIAFRRPIQRVLLVAHGKAKPRNEFGPMVTAFVDAHLDSYLKATASPDVMLLRTNHPQFVEAVERYVSLLSEDGAPLGDDVTATVKTIASRLRQKGEGKLTGQYDYFVQGVSDGQAHWVFTYVFDDELDEHRLAFLVLISNLLASRFRFLQVQSEQGRSFKQIHGDLLVTRIAALDGSDEAGGASRKAVHGLPVRVRSR